MKGGTLKKLRTFEEDMLLPNDKRVKIHFAVGLYDMGVGKDPVIQLSAVGIKSKLVKGDVSAVPFLPTDECGTTQLELISAARKRIYEANLFEIQAFRKGSFIQIQGLGR